MGYIATEINRAITNNHLKSHLLPLVYVDDLRASITKQYCTKNTTFIWECFKDYVSYQNSMHGHWYVIMWKIMNVLCFQ